MIGFMEGSAVVTSVFFFFFTSFLISRFAILSPHIILYSLKHIYIIITNFELVQLNLL